MSDVVGVHAEKHEFALHVESLSLLIQEKDPGDSLIFSDEKLFHRMMTVLRLRIGDTCIFFDQKIYITAVLRAFVGKKEVHVEIQIVQLTTVLHPKITFLLPVLKRDDYESALYALAETGVNTIQLVFTHKTENQWSGSRDSERARRILIAAAEQSKNFAYPTLKTPVFLQEALKEYDESGDKTVKIFFDPMGSRFFDVAQTLYSKQPEHILLFVGPEGDLTIEEKKMVRTHNFIFCALTPTILRAVHAATLAAGSVRSLLVSVLC
ncbi:MAG TPA: RsmE family RNA methyltransferase [Candidatus Babeliales bacterium]|jgi:RsmE family RNA methyltransferase|nr:RsmE family RNA methyltransferase [Candidatus Babeliales bacterium]